MSQKGLKIWLLVAVLATAVAWIVGQQEEARYGLAETEALAPALAERLADVDRLTVHAAGETPFSVLRQDGAWVIPERGGYPADTSVLRRELRKIAEARRLEPKTALPANYPQLGVEDIDAAEDTTLRLSAAAGETTVLDLLIGKSGSSGSYVRPAGEAQSWLADKRFSPPREIASWLDRELVDIDRGDLKAVTVTPAEGQAYRLEKSDREQQDFTLSPAPPEGRELNYANLNRVGAALSRLRLKDVLNELPEDLAWNETVYRRFDGLVLTARSASLDDERLLQLEARYEAPAAEAEDEATEEAAATPSPAPTPAEDPAALAADINARVAGWTYSVSSYNGDALSLKYDFLLKAEADDEE